MATFVEPSAEDFLDRYPEFVDFDPSLVSRLLKTAVDEVGPSWIERHRVPAILALTAFRLEQWVTQDAYVGAGDVSGPIVMKSVGPLTVRYQTGAQSGMRGGLMGGGPPTSVYLAEFERLQRLSFPSVAIA